MTVELAIGVSEVSRTFVIPHERRLRPKEYFADPGRRMTYEQNRALREVTFTVARVSASASLGLTGAARAHCSRSWQDLPRRCWDVRVSGRISSLIELGVGFNYELSARDNIEINGLLWGLTSEEVDARFDAIVAFAELERFVDQRLKYYSTGMILRLAYAIAIHVPFDILLLDEVLAVGDASFPAKCFESFVTMRNQGRTIILVSPDLGSVLRFCDRAMSLSEGAVERIGDSGAVVGSTSRAVAWRILGDTRTER